MATKVTREELIQALREMHHIVLFGNFTRSAIIEKISKVSTSLFSRLDAETTPAPDDEVMAEFDPLDKDRRRAADVSRAVKDCPTLGDNTSSAALFADEPATVQEQELNHE